MRGGEGPPGVVSIWAWSPSIFGHPLNLVPYIPFRIFAYSSNIIKTNFIIIYYEYANIIILAGYQASLPHDPSLGSKCSF